MIENTSATGAAYNDGNANPGAPSGPAAPTEFTDPFSGSGLQYADPTLPMMGPFAADAAYNSGNANPGAPWGPTAPTDFTDLFSDSGLQYADLTLPMMSPFAADANGIGNDYQGGITAPSFNTPLEATVDLPKTPHATHDSDLDLASQGPTCATCNESSTRKADRDRHALMHQAARFRCGIVGCAVKNYRKDKVSDHIRRRHGGVGAVVDTWLDGWMVE